MILPNFRSIFFEIKKNFDSKDKIFHTKTKIIFENFYLQQNFKTKLRQKFIEIFYFLSQNANNE